MLLRLTVDSRASPLLFPSFFSHLTVTFPKLSVILRPLYPNYGPVPAQPSHRLATEWTNGVRLPAEAKDFSSSLCVQTSSEAHPASYPMGYRGSFRWG
jgi:hypothetical protein